mmetsp:Transcript_122382/g.305467  ORF Transcript_122382/g.305467 Transcript_122382/m.305467 type:complete len:251 (+) Transcript_122382:91-843(+)
MLTRKSCRWDRPWHNCSRCNCPMRCRSKPNCLNRTGVWQRRCRHSNCKITGMCYCTIAIARTNAGLHTGRRRPWGPNGRRNRSGGASNFISFCSSSVDGRQVTGALWYDHALGIASSTDERRLQRSLWRGDATLGQGLRSLRRRLHGRNHAQARVPLLILLLHIRLHPFQNAVLRVQLLLHLRDLRLELLLRFLVVVDLLVQCIQVGWCISVVFHHGLVFLLQVYDLFFQSFLIKPLLLYLRNVLCYLDL